MFLSPWILGFLAFTVIPMVATLGFTFTNIQLANDEPVQFVGLGTTSGCSATIGVAPPARHAEVRGPRPARSAWSVPFALALLLNSRHLRGSSVFRILFFLRTWSPSWPPC